MKRLSYALAVTLGVVLAITLPALAARDNAGSFTVLNNGTSVRNPVAAGQVITKDLWNGTIGDIGTEITDSLSRSNKGAMLAPLRLYDSTTTTLDLTWDAAQTTGFYLASGPLLGVKVSASDVFTCTTAGCALPAGIAGGLTETTANTSLIMKGNRTGADSGADVVLGSVATRTVGSLLDVQNNGTPKFTLDFNGEPSLQGGYATGIVVTGSDQTLTTGTPTAVTGFLFPAVANGVYVVEAFFAASGGGSDKFNMNWTGPASPTSINWDLTGYGVSCATQTTYSAGGCFNTTTVNMQVYRSTLLLVNGANAGNVQLNFWSYTALGGTITFKKGALLRWRRVA